MRVLGRASRLDDGEQFHGRAAMRAARDRCFGENGLWFVEFAADQRADEQTVLACRTTHPAVMPNPHKTLGQHMREPAFEECFDRQRDDMGTAWPP